jgi:hypothetical protein
MVIGVPPDPGALEQLREGGCRRVVHWLPSANRSRLERAFERWESAIAELNGEA